MLRRLKVRYYFGKLKKGKMDIPTVALKLSVSLEKVKEEYARYINPFRKIKIEPIFSFAAVCISVCSILIAMETLNEMRKERELAYKPDLRVYENDIFLYWDKDGNETKRVDNYTHQYEAEEENKLYTVFINIDNIGTGNAKDIKYDWNYEDNIENFNLFLEGSDVKASILKEENIIEIERGDWWKAQSRMDDNNMESYISQGMQKRIIIPWSYLSLLTAYCYEKLPLSSEIEYGTPLTLQDFPKLYLLISYENIQGLEMKKKVEMGFEPIIYEKEENGQGNCMLRIRNLREEIIKE